MIPGLTKDVASINVAEKGYITLEIIASAAGGHSSLPPRETAVGRLARAIAKLQEAPYPGGLTGVSKDFFNGLGPHMDRQQRMVFANQWLFRPVLERILSGSAPTDAMLRTTIAPTMLAGSHTENVLPQRAVATVNFRIHPRDTIEGTIDHVGALLDDPMIEVKPRNAGNPPSPVSSSSSAGYRLLAQSFQQVFEGSIAVPGMTIAGTDTKHYSKIATDSYRINPFIFTADELPLIHGANERISIENLARGAQFYHLLLRKAAGGDGNGNG